MTTTMNINKSVVRNVSFKKPWDDFLMFAKPWVSHRNIVTETEKTIRGLKFKEKLRRP